MKKKKKKIVSLILFISYFAYCHKTQSQIRKIPMLQSTQINFNNWIFCTIKSCQPCPPPPPPPHLPQPPVEIEPPLGFSPPGRAVLQKLVFCTFDKKFVKSSWKSSILVKLQNSSEHLFSKMSEWKKSHVFFK